MPPALRALSGGRPPRSAADLSDGVHPAVGIPPMPRHLSQAARAEWKRITPLLEELGLISELDRAALALYCQAWGRVVELEDQIRTRQREAEAAGKTAAEALTRTTPTGFERESPLVRMAAEASVACDRYLAAFGMSPATRARVTASRNGGQLGLPGVEDPVAEKLAKLRAV